MFNNIIKNNIYSSKINKNKKIIEEEPISNIVSQNYNTIDIFSRRPNSARQKILYCNSFTRLFIGETDRDSILKRHLSNILVLKQDSLNVNGQYIDLSEGYLKNFFGKIYKSNSRDLLIDKVLKNVFTKFNEDQKYVNKYTIKSKSYSSKKTPNKKYHGISSEKNLSNKNNIDKVDKINIEEENFKKYDKYNINKFKNNNKIKRRIKTQNIRNKLHLKNDRSPSPIIDNESKLIKNIYKELSESKCFPIKKDNKKKKKMIIKTNFYSQIKNKNNLFRNNYNKSYNKGQQHNPIKTYNNYKKDTIKEYMIKRNYFFNN